MPLPAVAQGLVRGHCLERAHLPSQRTLLSHLGTSCERPSVAQSAHTVLLARELELAFMNDPPATARELRSQPD